MKDYKSIIKILLSICLLCIFIFISYFGDLELLSILKDDRIEELVLYVQGFGIWAPIISISFMVLQAIIAPIPSFVIAGANGVLFGFLGGVIISWIGALLGATTTFYLSRILGLNFIKKFEKEHVLMVKVNEISKDNGPMIIFFARLLPFISFDIISYAAGLTKISFSKFIIATAIGMLPATVVYVWLGEQVIKNLDKANQGFMILGLIIFLVWLIYKIWRRRRS